MELLLKLKVFINFVLLISLALLYVDCNVGIVFARELGCAVTSAVI